MEMIQSVLVTGASRGIGLEFVEQFLTSDSLQANIIIATCRSPETATALQELSKSSERVHILKLDVTQFDTYKEFALQVGSIVGDKGLTLLINSAGIAEGSLEDTLLDITPQRFISHFTTNSIAPVILTQALYPLLKQSAQVNSSETNNGLGIKRAAVINNTSILGSIKKCGSHIPRNWSYNESKAALNMSTQALAAELEKDGILVESIHPGVVRTDMTKGVEDTFPMIDKITSVEGIIAAMVHLKGKNKDGFLDYKGNVLPF
ncbi:unnamed protein product [Bemisia tabaci]|uniref:Uncharacterized protein n=1 Tax=Bemisia tabaci TaxID=7038 RepID=A0A9P0A3M4_BEMTA|nr:unnamed protein product [Bemisia tabaci]